MSTFIASILRIVSLKVSPLLTLLVEDEKLTASADNLFSASSNEILVRVEFSKNKLTTVLPCRVGTFLIGLSRTSLKVFVVSKIN